MLVLAADWRADTALRPIDEMLTDNTLAHYVVGWPPSDDFEAGRGEPPIVFVHGWSCDHTFFAPQADHFSTARRCVSVDLRGHHGLDAPLGEATIANHAADVIGLCEALAVERPVIAGHSMGGAIALEVAAQAPTLPVGLVLLDPALVSVAAVQQLQGFVAALESPDYQAAARGFIEENLFMPTDDDAVRTRVADVMLSAPQDVMVSEMKSIGEWRSSRHSHTWTLPVINILSGQPITDVQPTARPRRRERSDGGLPGAAVTVRWSRSLDEEAAVPSFGIGPVNVRCVRVSTECDREFTPTLVSMSDPAVVSALVVDGREPHRVAVFAG